MDSTILGAVIGAGASMLVVVVDRIFSHLQYGKELKHNGELLKHSQKVLNSQESQHGISVKLQKAADLERKLNEFYRTFKRYLDVSKNFYFLFREGKPDGFRTITYLIEKNKGEAPFRLTETDLVLLREIFSVGEKLETFLLEKSFLVDSGEMNMSPESKERLDKLGTNIPFRDEIKENDLLSLAAVHFRLIRLAHNGVIASNSEPYEAFVFPRELPMEIDRRIEELEKEIADLRK